MKSFQYLFSRTVFTLLLNLLAFSNAKNLARDEDNQINNMIYLGSVDGKSFFAEPTPGRTWFEAAQACNDSHMHLASITSESQAHLLYENKDTLNATKFYWTDGRDSLSISQFHWNAHNITASHSSLMFRLAGNLVAQTCLLYTAQENNGTLVANECGNAGATLCEIHH